MSRNSFLEEDFEKGPLKFNNKTMMTGTSKIAEDKVLSKTQTRIIGKLSEDAVNDIERIKKYLIQKGANPELKNRLNQTPAVWGEAQAAAIADRADQIIRGKTTEKNISYWPPLYQPIIPQPTPVALEEETGEIVV